MPVALFALWAAFGPPPPSRLGAAGDHYLRGALAFGADFLTGGESFFAMIVRRVWARSFALCPRRDPQSPGPHGIFLELNAHPEPLDLLDTYCRMERDEGVLVSVNPDAHSVQEFDNRKYSVRQARRGRLSEDNVLNLRPLSELKRLFAQRPGVSST